MYMKNQIPSLHKAINILEYLKENPDQRLKELSQVLNIPVSTCFNILSTLENREMVKKNSNGQYRLGYKIMHLGLSVYHNIDIRNIAKPKLKEISDYFGGTAYLSIVDHTSLEALVIDRSVSEKSKLVIYLHAIGEKAPLYASGTGKSLLSGLTDLQLKEFLQKVDRTKFTEHTIVDEELLINEIRDIQKQGYATAYSELEVGIGSISAPIINSDKEVVAAISIAGLLERMLTKETEIICAVMKAAKEISGKIGYERV